MNILRKSDVHVLQSDAILNSRLMSALCSPVKDKRPKKFEIDPSKNFMAKNIEKLS
jgi:hypothetical protein